MLQNLVLQKARGCSPRRPTLAQVAAIRSEVDEFPYQSFFRGTLGCAPVVFDRAAGWAPQHVVRQCPEPAAYPQHCWQTPCNTVATLERVNGKCVPQQCVTMYR